MYIYDRQDHPSLPDLMRVEERERKQRGTNLSVVHTWSSTNARIPIVFS